MSNIVIALFLAVGCSAWIYAKFLRKTGNNSKNSIIVTIFGGIFIFVGAWYVLGIFFNK